jgi:hypothetical protein
LDLWEEDEMHVQDDENVVLCLPMKWMGYREKTVKKTRGGRKSSKRLTPRTKESTGKPNARWKRRRDNLSWSQD